MAATVLLCLFKVEMAKDKATTYDELDRVTGPTIERMDNISDEALSFSRF